MSLSITEIVLASSNPGKLKELQTLLGDSVKLHLISDFTDQSPKETGLSFVENALLKARHAAQISGLAALADDSGLAVDYLGGAPGIYSARYAEVATHQDAANNAKLLAALNGVPDERRSAQFVCSLALLRHAKDPLPTIAQGIWHGCILHAPRGTNGFGYDPLFFIAELNQSSAELTAAEKNQQSHRARAMQQLKQQLATKKRYC
ncbi:non-canonical purine NTP pyrophosphatase [Ventosimonas gracilis]|uniref:dITP/XTP pyrophosphatase n=1 Tax=Ventosimonas gracilis TaxID=1680762 RepID=A0A139SWL5_9GAMM|nr:RdgB/HAM1 family non-canonical purine NTP pyrophosphatase [Ventosimonas gracilis]KXU38978.1 non-canonical purine NTP pyrophosphatase [Ventosimonas gracilis]